MRSHLSKLAVFDMDGTLIKGRLINILSKRHNTIREVKKIQSDGSLFGYQKTIKIAKLLSGMPAEDIESSVDALPLMKNSRYIISALKKKGYIIGIITDSYDIAAIRLLKRLDLDFFAANTLEVKEGRITGNVIPPLGWEKINCHCKISVCKKFHLQLFTKKYGVSPQNTIAIGDTCNDLCMLQYAGIGVGFMPKDNHIKKFNNIINKPDLSKILEYVPNKEEI